MYIQLVSIHGLIRGGSIEMGRDADTGGQVRYVVELAKALGSSDEVERVDLFTRQIRDKRVSSDYSETIEQLGPKCRIVRLPCGGGRYHRKEKLWPYLDDYVDAMISFTRSEGVTPSLVHGHYADAGYVAKEVASAFGVPLIFTGHSLGRSKLQYLQEKGMGREAINKQFNIDLRIRVEEACLSMADRVIVGTTHERDQQYLRYNSADQPAYEVIPPGLRLERFFPYYDYELAIDQIDENYKQARIRMQEELSRFHLHHDKPFILALCRPEQRKNINGLIKAYGEDKELQALANLAVFAGVRKNIEEMGDDEQHVLKDILLLMDAYDLYGRMAVPKRHDSETDVPELYRLAASQRGVFVNPTFIENFGLTLIESSAVGLPFVATDNGGPRDIEANCESGLIVDVSDEQKMADAIKRVITDSSLWQRCSQNGINRVRESYSWGAHCKKYLDCVRPLVHEPSLSAASTQEGTEPYGKLFEKLDFLLVSDIDNTLLGDDAALKELYAVLQEHKGSIGFGVASGRHPDLVEKVLAAHGIEVDFVIAAVGTEIFYGANRVPDKGWASHLRAKWRPERIHEALDPLPFLHLQEDPKAQSTFKISFDLDNKADPEEAIPAIHDALSNARAAYRLIFSHGTFIDILPNRASKGKAVRYLSGKWNIPLDHIATAGDSGNDSDMLKGQTAGIAVGNHAPELETLRQTADRVYFAEACCSAGILEGLEHYEFLKSHASVGD